MADPYSDLSLDNLLVLATADKNNLPKLQAQSSVSRDLSEQLTDGLNHLFFARAVIDNNIAADANLMVQMLVPDIFHMLGVVFVSQAANATFRTITELANHSDKASSSITPQTSAFDELISDIEHTHGAMSELQHERDTLLRLVANNPQDPRLAEYGATTVAANPEQLITAIHESFNAQGRQLMSKQTAEYLRVVENLDSIEPYTGPRIPDPTDDQRAGSTTTYGPKGVNNHTSNRPTISDSARALGLPNTPSTPVDQVTLQNGPQSSSVLDSAPTRPTPPVPSQGSAAPSTGIIGPGGSYTANRPVARGIIGNRPTNTAPSGRQVFSPRPPRDVTRPIIGERSTKTGNTGGRIGSSTPGRFGTGRGTPSRTGTTPALPRGGNRAASTSNARAYSLPRKTPTTPSKTFNSSRAGARSGQPPKPVTTSGRVIRGSADQRPKSAKPTPFTRARRQTHGGNDNVNRTVIRNSRAPRPAPSRTSKKVDNDSVSRTAEQDSTIDWLTDKPTVRSVIEANQPDVSDIDHDPGDFLTRHNLGRRR